MDFTASWSVKSGLFGVTNGMRYQENQYGSLWWTFWNFWGGPLGLKRQFNPPYVILIKERDSYKINMADFGGHFVIGGGPMDLES